MTSCPPHPITDWSIVRHPHPIRPASVAASRLVHCLTAAALLCATGCASSAPPPEPPAASSAPDTTSAGATPTAPTSAAASPAKSGQRCHTSALSAKLGSRTPAGTTGQGWLPLIYTNTSSRSCLLRGIPGLDLHGPADPNGPTYTLPRQDRGGAGVMLAPGASATARLVILSDEPGSTGSMGSTNWVPTQLVTIPPGETAPLTLRWPAGLTVTRQDSATHPGSWIESFAAKS